MLQMVGCKYTVFLLLKIGDSFTEALKPSLPPRGPERTRENSPKKTAVTLPPIEPTTGGRVNLPVPRKSHLGRESLPLTGRVSHPLTSLFFTGRIFHRKVFKVVFISIHNLQNGNQDWEFPNELKQISGWNSDLTWSTLVSPGKLFYLLILVSQELYFDYYFVMLGITLTWVG